jgi:hypothetical protein
MVIILVAIALIGVVTLALLARRYSQAFAERSSVAAEEASGTIVAEIGPTAEAIDGFLAGRRAVIAHLDSDPVMKDSLCAEVRDDIADRERIKMYHAQLLQVRTKRASALIDTGLTEHDYFAVRERFRKWKAGDPSLEVEWAEVLEANRDRLDPVYLGACESIDY